MKKLELTPKRKELLTQFQDLIGVSFQNLQFLETALTHKSYSNEKKRKIPHNEKYEFLGDSVIDLVLAELIMNKYPEEDEGELSKMRAYLVNEEQLARIAKQIKIGEFLNLGRGEESTEGRAKNSILANAFEALLAAIYLDSGLSTCFKYLESIFTPYFKDLESNKENYFKDYKTLLQETLHSQYHEAPTYQIIEEKADRGKPFFVVEVQFRGKTIGKGEGISKKRAEQQAAEFALNLLKDSLEYSKT